MRNLILCVDIGGSHISSAVLDSDSMALVAGSLQHQLVDSLANRSSILLEWDRALVQSINCVDRSISALLVSIPGPFDYDRGVCLMDGMHKYQDLLGMNLKEYFSSKYDIVKNNIFFFNDAQAFLLGEVYHHGWTDKRIVGLTLGTGLGSALFDEKMFKDLNYGSAPFREGIAEDYISTRGIVHFLNEQLGCRFEHIKQLVEDVNADVARRTAFSFLTVALIDFMKQYIVPLNPDFIVLGGSISKANHLFIKDLQAAIAIPLVIASMDEINLFYGMAETADLTNQS